jgi:CheY-like chemotaxis protein
MTEPNSHILVVDDNPENIRVLGTVLRKSDYRVTIAQNGVQALEAIEKFIPDLILLDIMMPEMDGFQACEILKADPRTKDIEVIFVTAAVAHTDELKGLSLGAVDYIHKPFSVPLVQAKVALHLERAHSKRQLRLKNIALEENARLREDIERVSRHDLKTPLNALIGYPQLMLMDDNLTDEQRGFLEEMLSAGNEMLNMINSSLDLFKMETGRYHYVPEPTDLLAVINRVISDLRMLAETQKIKIDIAVIGQEHHETKAFVVLAEKNLSYSLFANLIRNAIEACSAGNRISIVMKYENNLGVILITNPGQVPEEIRATFFEKYSTAGKAQGTGLGTYSAKLMAEIQNGSIAMTTNNQETCVTVSLPVCD